MSQFFLSAFCLPITLLLFSHIPVAQSAGATLTNTRSIIQVGPQRTIHSLASASALARDGDTIEVDAGDYVGDVAIWTQKNLTIRGLAGRVRLLAGGRSAEGKATWVMRSGSLTVENIEFLGSRVADKNGAGIRFESGELVVRNCAFLDNENGILTANDGKSELTIENSEFGRNGANDGQSHNLYVGKIRKLTVVGSYFHHGKSGQLLKSRAAESHISYNRLTDELGGRASYELEFPSGGIAYVIGNIIQQSSQTENRTIVSFAAESYAYPRNELYLINNTIVDDRPQHGSFLTVRPGQVKVQAINNLLVGSGTLEPVAAADYRNNMTVDWDQFVQASRQDYRLNSSSQLIGKAENPGQANQVSLAPAREYVHPRQTRAIDAKHLNPGALQTIAGSSP